MTDVGKAWDNARGEIAIDFRNALVRACPVNSGHLKNSIAVDVNNDYIDVTMADYGLHVEFGTKPHVIEPKDAKALSWETPRGRVFTKKVHHPGTKANPFIRRTIHTRLKDIILTNLRRHLQ